MISSLSSTCQCTSGLLRYRFCIDWVYQAFWLSLPSHRLGSAQWSPSELLWFQAVNWPYPAIFRIVLSRCWVTPDAVIWGHWCFGALFVSSSLCLRAHVGGLDTSVGTLWWTFLKRIWSSLDPCSCLSKSPTRSSTGQFHAASTQSLHRKLSAFTS